MKTEEAKELLERILEEYGYGSDYTGVIDSTLIPYILLGRAADRLWPGTAATIKGWLIGNPPTDEEKENFIKNRTTDNGGGGNPT